MHDALPRVCGCALLYYSLVAYIRFYLNGFARNFRKFFSSKIPIFLTIGSSQDLCMKRKFC